MKYCVYNHNIIDRGILSHYRQFRETRDGDQLLMFPNNRAIIEIDLADRYKVRTAIGEGFDEAIRRIHYAQPYVEMEGALHSKNGSF